MKELFKGGDAAIAFTVLFLSLALLFPNFGKSDSGELTAVVYENGKITHEIPLSSVTRERKIEINGGVLLLEKDAVSYIEADCPDKLCIHFGKLTKSGQTASCVPNGTVVVLREDKAEIDALTY